MRVVIYKSCLPETDHCFTCQVESLIPESQREIHTDIDSYERALRYPFSHRIITVLVIEFTHELVRIIQRGILEGIANIILILPKDDAGVISLGHRQHPRFVAYTGEPFDKVALVLSKMLGLSQTTFLQEPVAIPIDRKDI